jgi:hypothetical protein
MPINPNSLSSPEPDDHTPDEIADKVEHDDLAEESQVDPQTPGTSEEIAQETQSKRTRRTKKQMTADAVVPADDEVVLIKDVGTGAKLERQWLVALELVRGGQATFADKAMNYAMAKYDEQKKNPEQLGAQEPAETDVPSDPTPALEPTVASGMLAAPEGAALGDQVVIGAETYTVGHQNTLVKGQVTAGSGEIVVPKRIWQRELGAGPEGPWMSRVLSSEPDEPTVPVEQAEEKLVVEQASNGKADIDVVPERIPHTVDEIAPGTFKVGTGMLEKIGLPNYSSLQIGPLTLSRTVQDDGRRTKTTVNGREATVIAAVVESFEEMDNTLEFISARFRGQLQSFLEATGALNQPVS